MPLCRRLTFSQCRKFQDEVELHRVVERVYNIRKAHISQLLFSV